MAGTAAFALLSASAPAFAQVSASTAQRLANIEAQLADQNRRLADQERRLQTQEQIIQAQAVQLNGLHNERERLLSDIRAGRELAETERPLTVASNASVAQVGPTADDSPQPVGEAPPPERRAREVAAIPEGMGVLTPRGTLIIDPSIEYTRTSSNRLVFRGVEIVPGIQLGVIEANDADRDSLTGALSARFGLTNRIEVSASIPYVYRQDRVTTVQQRDETVARAIKLEGQEWGDLDVSARYQINAGLRGWPVFVANLRAKPPTGVGPFDVNYDEFGVAKDLATGSGFWGVSAGVTAIYPTDPAVIFGSFDYLYNVPKDINKTIGNVPVGSIDPGDSISATLGFGLALNPRFSFSLGYSHSYIFPTDSDLGNTVQRSNSLQVGRMLMGWSFRLSERVTLNNNFEFGVTSDAPDMRMVVRVPYRF